MPSRIVFLGPPGAGKGTQAARIARELGVPHLSTGELLRAAVRDGTEPGQRAEAHMRAGHLVPDGLVLAILGERIERPDCATGFLLDGFPRNVAQARALDRVAPIDHVLAFRIPEEALVERLTQRRTCPRCGTGYNLTTAPPRVAGRCDHDGEALVQRSDDAESAVRTRLEVYRKETAPLVDFYRSRGVLTEVDASGSPAEVAGRVRAALG
jgi:adenylate kinase